MISWTPAPFSMTALTLLTLDVRSNRPNYPTLVDLDFYSENEVLLSTAHEFVCWSQIALQRPQPEPDGDGVESQGAGRVGPGRKVPDWGHCRHGRAGHAAGDRRDRHLNGACRAYSYTLYNNSVPVPTVFEP